MGLLEYSDIKDVRLPFSLLSGSKPMLRDIEVKLLYHLAKEYAIPGKEVVDAGAFTGGSARALSAGLDARSDRELFLKRVHSYDRFIVNTKFYKKLLLDTAEIGDSFLPQYLHNISPWSNYINVYPGDFLKSKWIGKPISILFCDICKSHMLDRYVWRYYITSMVPEESIFIQQDFVHIQAPFLHLSLAVFHDHFEFDSIFGSSIVLRYRKEIDPRSALDGYWLHQHGGLDEKMDAISALEKRVKPLDHLEAQGTLSLIKSVICIKHEEPARARGYLHEAQELREDVTDPYYLARVASVEGLISKQS